MSRQRGKSRLFLAASVGVIGVPGLYSQASQRPAFEVAAVKENKSTDFRGVGMQFLPGGRLAINGLPLFMIVAAAYDLPFQSDRLTGGPDWVRQERYDIEATAEKGAIPEGAPVKVRDDQMRLMLQTLLAERFKMVIRSETKDLPVYTVVVAKGGPKLQKATVEEKDCLQSTPGPDDSSGCHRFRGGQGQGLHGQAVSLPDLVSAVSNFADRPVIDKTGLPGLFNVQTDGWVPMRPRPPRPPGQEATPEDLAFADLARPTLFQIFDRLGLKLEPGRAPVAIFVIQSAEHSAGN